ncbi:MAG: hypothetical protein IK014_01230 [Lachnospiraceae bacterium]|nr:hypothetical protein [Lachnospiraceae bacterium]
MTDKNSFETVELLKPIELTPIEGIEGAKPITEPTPVVEPKPVVEHVVETVKVRESSTWDAVRKNSSPEFYQQDFDGQYDRGSFNQESFNQNGFEQGSFAQGNSQKAAGIDLSCFYNAEEQKRKQALDKRKRDVYLVSVIVFLAFIVAAIGFSRGANRRSNKQDINNSVQKQVTTNDYARQDDVYGFMYFDASGTQAADFFYISPDVIEYTGPFERVLYFEYTPKSDNKVLRVGVEMLDSYGNSIGNVVAFKKNVPAGETAIVAIPFGIDQLTELTGITYNIEMEGYTLQTPEDNKNIVSTEQSDDVLYVTIEGGLNVDKDTYVVFYKDGRVSSVMSGVPKYNSGGRATFYIGDIDFDNYEVFY